MSDIAVAMTVDLMAELFRTMLRIRMVEDRVADLVEAGEIKCPCHLYVGQEAIAAGVCAALRERDFVFGGHRSHGHYLAKGGDLREMMAELYGKASGCSRGRGGSMHLVAPHVGIPGTVPIVAATIPMAVGAALASRLRGDEGVSVTFFGDGAVEEGTFHEAMNLASVRRLPVIFVCENNLFSSHLELLERRALDNIVASAEAHGMPGVRLDGNDVNDVYAAASIAVEGARRGEGPTLLECRTYRWRGHVGPSFDLDVGVKRRDQLVEWQKKDPIARARAWLIAKSVMERKLEEVCGQIREEIEQAVIFARESPYPDPRELSWYVFTDSEPRELGR